MTKDYNNLFDEDDDFLNTDLIEPRSSPKVLSNEEDDDDDDLMLASGHPRQRGAIIEDDENSLGTE